MPGLGDHQSAMRMPRISHEMFVTAGVVEADDRGADQRRAAEGEQVVRRVVEQERDVPRRIGREVFEKQRGEPA